MRVLAILASENPVIPLELQRRGHDVRCAITDATTWQRYAGIPQLGSRAAFGGAAAIERAASAWNGAPPELVINLSLATSALSAARRAKELFGPARFIGTSDASFSALEEDRGAFKEACRQHGIRAPAAEAVPLTDLRAQLATRRWPAMLKPFSYREAAGVSEKYLVARVRDAAEAAVALDLIEDAAGGRGVRVLVEEVVQGFEISCGAFFDGGEFRGPWHHMVEYKSFAAGDVGPNIDEPAVHCAVAPQGERDALALEVRKLVPLLRSTGYRGYFDLNFIVDGERVAWALEPDCRFPMPAAAAFLAESDLAEVLAALCDGRELPWSPSPHAVVAGGLHIGFPFCSALPDAFRRKPLTGLHRSRRAFPVSLGAFDASLGEWLVETNNGYLFACVGTGPTIAAARADLRAAFESVRYPYVYYRADVGCRPAPDWLAWERPRP